MRCNKELMQGEDTHAHAHARAHTHTRTHTHTHTLFHTHTHTHQKMHTYTHTYTFMISNTEVLQGENAESFVEESRTSSVCVYIYIYMHIYSNTEVLISNTEVLQGENAKSFVEESRTSSTAWLPPHSHSLAHKVLSLLSLTLRGTQFTCFTSTRAQILTQLTHPLALGVSCTSAPLKWWGFRSKTTPT